MEEYKIELIKLLLETGALKFGSFKTKSGRIAPYFINTGCFTNGNHLRKLGGLYCECILRNNITGIDILFGPAYKGIPLVVSVAITMDTVHNKNYHYCFNRKESKDHGEGGLLIGSIPKDNDNILVIEDVITAGTSIRDSYKLLRTISDANITGQVILVDRMEKGTNGRTAVAEIKEDLNIDTYALVNIIEVIEYLENNPINGLYVISKEQRIEINKYWKTQL